MSFTSHLKPGMPVVAIILKDDEPDTNIDGFTFIKNISMFDLLTQKGDQYYIIGVGQVLDIDIEDDVIYCYDAYMTQCDSEGNEI